MAGVCDFLVSVFHGTNSIFRHIRKRDVLLNGAIGPAKTFSKS